MFGRLATCLNLLPLDWIAQRAVRQVAEVTTSRVRYLAQSLAFIVLLLVTGMFATWRGGAPEKTIGAVMLAGALATAAANANGALGYRAVEWQLLWIDVAVLGAFTAVALYANRFWPLWLAALQCIAVAAHGVRAFDPNLLPLVYWWLLGKISYPMILIWCIGVMRHHRRQRMDLPSCEPPV